MKKVVLVVLVAMAFFSSGFAQPGVLDQTFGDNGKVTFRKNGFEIVPKDVKMQADGKFIVLAEASKPGQIFDRYLARYQPNGLLDSSFGVNGISPTQTGYLVSSLAIQADGKILVSGELYVSALNNYDWCVSRYNANGSVDATFGNNGIVVTAFTASNNTIELNDKQTSIAVLANGKILQSGYGSQNNLQFIEMIRLNPDGSVDNSFGVNGKVMTPATFNTSAGAPAITFLLPNNQLMAISKSAIVQYKANGAIDSSFGTNGMVAIAGFDVSAGIMQPDGKIVVVGKTPPSTKVYVTRYNSNGSLDNTFSTVPFTDPISTATQENFYKILLEPNGKLVLAGTEEGFGAFFRQFVLLKLNSNGKIDSTFGKRGRSYTNFTYGGFGYAAAMQTDGKIIVAGNTLFSLTIQDQVQAIARFEKNARVYYNSLTVDLFNDANTNGIRDGGENLVKYSTITSVKPGVDTVNTYSCNGHFVVDVDSGTYIHKPTLTIPYANIVPATYTTSHASFFNNDAVEFAMQLIPGKRDLAIEMVPLNIARPGFVFNYKIIYQNKGTDTISSGTIELIRSNKLAFSNSNPMAIYHQGDTLRWSIGSLKPLDTGSVTVFMNVLPPPTVNIGDSAISIVSIVSDKPDLTPADNIATVKQVIRGSFDPNDKTENHGGQITATQVANGDYLTYTIRFQNTGNDTAFNVYIRDTLDSKLDWNTMQVLTSSHDYQMIMDGANKCLFAFNNIKLVDSITNEPGSHGYIVYRIKPRQNVQIGDIIKNSAAIYFDYNLPIFTNTEMTTVVAEALPLKLLSFVAKKEDQKNLLFWSTANEMNVKHFVIERSNNGRTFLSIGKINAGAYNYQFTDNYPMPTANYYRLKMVDKDGQYAYSQVRLLSNTKNHFSSVYPNPAKDNLYIQTESAEKASVYIVVMSLDGKVLLEKMITTNKGSNNHILSISRLPKGSYFLRLIYSANPSLKGNTQEDQVLEFEKL